MRLAARPGYSLVEMLFTVVIGMLIAGGIITLLISQIQLTATQNRNMINQETLRDVVRFMTDEIKLADTLDGSEPILAANSSELSFHADIDGNDVIDTVAYYVVNGTLMRRFNTTTASGPFQADDPLMTGVASLTFLYYAVDDAAPANIGEITSVEVQLVMDTSASDTGFTTGRLAPQQMAGRATIRNKLLN